jgi:hypothetical protein
MTNFQVYILAFALLIGNATIALLLIGYMNAKFEAVAVRLNGIDQRFASLEKLIDQRFESLEREIHREGR